MIDCKCSFSITLIKDDFACEQAQLVTRRGGPDIACSSEKASERCKKFFAEFKVVGLPAFDAEDDLLKTPASIFTKIQFGGLLGLAKVIVEDEAEIKKVDNINQLLKQSVALYESLNNIPYAELVGTMTEFKIKRNKKRTASK